MKCTKCGQDYSDKFDQCPDCKEPNPNFQRQSTNSTQLPPKQKKPITKKWWFWVIIVVLALAVIGGVSQGSDKDNEKSSSNSSESSQTDSKTDSNSSNQQTDAPTEEPTTVPGIGSTVDDNGVKITFESLDQFTSDNEFLQPDEGKVFLKATFEINNTSNSEVNFSSLMSIDAYLDGYALDEDLTAISANEGQHLDGTVASGKKLKGSLCYQVDLDWKEIEFSFESQGLFSDDVVFTAKNNK